MGCPFINEEHIATLDSVASAIEVVESGAGEHDNELHEFMPVGLHGGLPDLTFHDDPGPVVGKVVGLSEDGERHGRN
jgi:hypothetical protein